MVEIKQYGLHRSGTNFLRVILQENYDVSVLTNIGGWKHGFYDLPQRLGRDGPEHKITSANPMQHWVRMNEHWLALELKEHQKFVFRYEEVLADPVGSIRE